MPPDKSFSETFDGTPRGAAGDVWIRFEEINHVRYTKVVRPIAVFGNVVVCGTGTRKSAPDPISDMPLSGIVDAHKGHLMALELGGPDHKANIVPQWAGWQSSGPWRKMEVAVKKDAQRLAKGSYLFYCVSVIYYKGGDPTLMSRRRLTFPQGFIVTTQVMTDGVLVGTKKVRFNSHQEQDQTDDLLALRAFLKADTQDDPTLTAKSMYDDTRVVTRKGMEKLKFVRSGESSLYRPIPPVTYSLGDSGTMGSMASSHLTSSQASLALPGSSTGKPKRKFVDRGPGSTKKTKGDAMSDED